MNAEQANYQFQKVIAVVGVLLLITKFTAWYITSSVAILTDALESIINVVSGFIGLFSLYLSAQPKDQNHPYGHGKVEFISAAIEGTLIAIAGIVIVYEAIDGFFNPKTITQLDYGIVLVAITAVINYMLGYWAIKRGKKNGSLALEASGKHLQSDTYSTVGIIIGLILLSLTKLQWLDSTVAIIFGGVILFTGYKIVRSSLAGIMDEADSQLLREVVEVLQKNRETNWIDLHNLRIIKFGTKLHLDCHLTVPWFFSVRQAHQEVDTLEQKVRNAFGESVEMFVHTDDCHDFSCKICSKEDCQFRASKFMNTVEWTVENISYNAKHNEPQPNA